MGPGQEEQSSEGPRFQLSITRPLFPRDPVPSAPRHQPNQPSLGAAMMSPIVPEGHGEQGWVSSPGTGVSPTVPQPPSQTSTFRVLSESDSSELSCTSMSGS